MVKKIDSYQFSKRFKKEYKALPKEIQKTFPCNHSSLSGAFLGHQYGMMECWG
jgi:hypothetical protein